MTRELKAATEKELRAKWYQVAKWNKKTNTKEFGGKNEDNCIRAAITAQKLRGLAEYLLRCGYTSTTLQDELAKTDVSKSAARRRSEPWE